MNHNEKPFFEEMKELINRNEIAMLRDGNFNNICIFRQNCNGSNS